MQPFDLSYYGRLVQVRVEQEIISVDWTDFLNLANPAKEIVAEHEKMVRGGYIPLRYLELNLSKLLKTTLLRIASVIQADFVQFVIREVAITHEAIPYIELTPTQFLSGLFTDNDNQYFLTPSLKLFGHSHGFDQRRDIPADVPLYPVAILVKTGPVVPLGTIPQLVMTWAIRLKDLEYVVSCLNSQASIRPLFALNNLPSNLGE